MKQLLSLYLVASFLLGPLQTWASDEGHQPQSKMSNLERSSGEKAFLGALEARISTFLDINLGKVTLIIECLKMRLGQKSLAMGETCALPMKQISNQISILYPRARKHLLLMNLLYYKNLAPILWLYADTVNALKNQSAQPLLPFKKMHIENPLSETVLKSETLPEPAWTDTEIEYALSDKAFDGFNALLRNMCIKTETDYKRTQDLCSGLQLNYQRETKSFYFSLPMNEKNWDERLADVQFLRPEMSPEFVAQPEAQRNAYFEIVQLHPYIALVEPNSLNSQAGEPQFSVESLVAAFSIIEKRARISQSEYEEMKRQLGQIDFDKNYDRRKWLPLLAYDTVVTDVLNNPNRGARDAPRADKANTPQNEVYTAAAAAYDMNDIVDKLMSDYFAQNMLHETAQMTEQIATSLLVCWGPGKALGFLAEAPKLIRIARAMNAAKNLTAALWTPFCMPVTMFFINLSMLSDSSKEYSQIYREVFSSVDGEYLLREVSALSTGQRGLFWMILMLSAPLALKGTGSFVNAAAALSPVAKQIAERFPGVFSPRALAALERFGAQSSTAVK